MKARKVFLTGLPIGGEHVTICDKFFYFQRTIKFCLVWVLL